MFGTPGAFSSSRVIPPNGSLAGEIGTCPTIHLEFTKKSFTTHARQIPSAPSSQSIDSSSGQPLPKICMTTHSPHSSEHHPSRAPIYYTSLLRPIHNICSSRFLNGLRDVRNRLGLRHSLATFGKLMSGVLAGSELCTTSLNFLSYMLY